MQTSQYSASQIADWFISSVNYDSGDVMTHLKLQKLLYYAQAWHLVHYNTPLFDDKIEAWVHGPVVVSQYNRFRQFCNSCAIPLEEVEFTDVTHELSTEVKELLKEINSVYGEHSAYFLEQLTHSEDPWKHARGEANPTERTNAEISHQAIQVFYSQLKANHG